MSMGMFATILEVSKRGDLEGVAYLARLKERERKGKVEGDGGEGARIQ
jgi:hypothetical protein